MRHAAFSGPFPTFVSSAWPRPRENTWRLLSLSLSLSFSASCASRETERPEIEGEGVPRLANTSLIARIERPMNYAYASVCCVRGFARVRHAHLPLIIPVVSTSIEIEGESIVQRGKERSSNNRYVRALQSNFRRFGYLTRCAGNWFADHNEWPNRIR